MFSKVSLSVKRLEEICRIIDINFYDLVMMRRRDSHQLSNVLPYGQKKALSFLRKLDKLGLIEWHSGDRIRILVSKNIFWEKDGPIMQTYRDHIGKHYFNYSFDQPNDRFVFGPGLFSEHSLKIIRQKIDDLAR